PLLPLPTTTTTRRPYRPPATRMVARATASPAASISESTVTPRSALRRSRSALSAGVRIGCTSRTPGPSVPHGHAERRRHPAFVGQRHLDLRHVELAGPLQRRPGHPDPGRAAGHALDPHVVPAHVADPAQRLPAGLAGRPPGRVALGRRRLLRAVRDLV